MFLFDTSHSSTLLLLKASDPILNRNSNVTLSRKFNSSGFKDNHTTHLRLNSTVYMASRNNAANVSQRVIEVYCNCTISLNPF